MAVIIETSERTMVSGPKQMHGLARLSQFIDYAFWLLYISLILRLLLVFFHASSGAGFVHFVDDVTNPFYAPFRDIVASQDVDGGFTLAVPIWIALLVYGLLHLAINRLLRVIAYRRTRVSAG